MTRGALIFAFNNEETDYVEMAAWSARRIRKFLSLPVAIITNSTSHPRIGEFEMVIEAVPGTGGTRYFEDYQTSVTWHNAGRTDAFDLTPWDETLVLDADYVVSSSDLAMLWGISDFMCHRYAQDMSTGKLLDGLNQFGRYKLPMWWATVMMFRKSNTAQYIFDCMHMIRNNWQHYRDLYSIDNKTYRNDFALSIALGIVNGHTGKVDEIPWHLQSVLPSTKLSRSTADLDDFLLEYTSEDNRLKQMSFLGMDFHAMGKKHLGDIIEADFRTRLLDSSQ